MPTEIELEKITPKFIVFRESLLSQIKDFEKTNDVKVHALRNNEFVMSTSISFQNSLYTKHENI